MYMQGHNGCLVSSCGTHGLTLQKGMMLLRDLNPEEEKPDPRNLS